MRIAQKTFCPNCYSRQEILVKTKPVTLEIRGIVFDYVEVAGYCAECGEPLYSPILNDVNVHNRETAYFRKFNEIAGIGGA